MNTIKVYVPVYYYDFISILMQQLSVSSAQKQVLETSSLSYFLPSYFE